MILIRFGCWLCFVLFSFHESYAQFNLAPPPKKEAAPAEKENEPETIERRPTDEAPKKKKRLDKNCVTKFIGHRGNKKNFPENTIPAFKDALKKIDGIEVDVRHTKDGQLIAFHDSTVVRTTSAFHNNFVHDMSFAELRALDAGSWFGEEFNGLRIPSLEEVLALGDGSKILVLDVKSPDTIDLLVKAGPQLKKANWLKIYLASSSLATLEKFKATLPQFSRIHWVDKKLPTVNTDPALAKTIRLPNALLGKKPMMQELKAKGFQFILSCGRAKKYKTALAICGNANRGRKLKSRLCPVKKDTEDDPIKKK